MTRRKDAVNRNFPPRVAARETMAYLLDMSVATFDKMVAAGTLPPAREVGGIKRWSVETVLAKWTGDNQDIEGGEDAFLANLEAFRCKAPGQRQRRCQLI